MVPHTHRIMISKNTKYKNPCQWKLLQAKYSHKNLERERERVLGLGGQAWCHLEQV